MHGFVVIILMLITRRKYKCYNDLFWRAIFHRLASFLVTLCSLTCNDSRRTSRQLMTLPCSPLFIFQMLPKWFPCQPKCMQLEERMRSSRAIPAPTPPCSTPYGGKMRRSFESLRPIGRYPKIQTYCKLTFCQKSLYLNQKLIPGNGRSVCVSVKDISGAGDRGAAVGLVKII